MTIATILALLALGVISVALVVFWKDIVRFLTKALIVAGFAIIRLVYRAGKWVGQIFNSNGRKEGETDPTYITDEEIDKMVETGVLTPEEGGAMKRNRDFSKRCGK